MLTVLAHRGPPRSVSDLWTSWNVDPLLVLGVVSVAWLHHRGQRPGERSRLFWVGLGALVVAIMSPLDALSGSLASAHMVQHLLLVLVAPPLLVLSAPLAALRRGTPRPLQRRVARWWRNGVLRRGAELVLDHPGATALGHVLVVWFWHAPGPYDAAVDNELIHVVEHATFAATALATWGAILHRSRRSQPRVGSLLVVFVLSVQSSLLGALLTFAPAAWYRSYETTASAWSLTPLADQQLAGVVMWVPAGGIYLVAALWMLSAWTSTPPPPRGSDTAAHPMSDRPPKTTSSSFDFPRRLGH